MGMMTKDMELAAPTSNIEFNTSESTINTPDIALEVFENIFNEPGIEIASPESNLFTEPETRIISLESDLFQNIEYETTMQETDMNTVETTDMTESVWGPGTFNNLEENVYELCAPDSVVEGTFHQENVIGTPSGNDPLEIENIDLLQWIVDDQNINFQEAIIQEEKEKFVKTEIERVSVIVPVQRQVPKESTPVVEIKIENLNEDEKYRKMRHQNNEASKRCRANRKRKSQELEDELIELERRNVVLRAKMDSMEREVKLLKKKFLSDISLSSKICI